VARRPGRGRIQAVKAEVDTLSENILDEDHYDLQKVKDRSRFFPSVALKPKHEGAPILCFVGPPGVGKLRWPESIARSLGRKFQHVARWIAR